MSKSRNSPFGPIEIGSLTLRNRFSTLQAIRDAGSEVVLASDAEAKLPGAARSARTLDPAGTGSELYCGDEQASSHDTVSQWGHVWVWREEMKRQVTAAEGSAN